MSLMEKLRQAEVHKNHDKYIDIAANILERGDGKYPNVLLNVIKERRDYYILRRLARPFSSLTLADILVQLKLEDWQILKKSCPGIEKSLPDLGIQNGNLLPFRQCYVEDVSITKSKHLMITSSAQRSEKINLGLFQFRLSSDFSIVQLKAKSTYKNIHRIEERFVLDNEFMPIFAVCLDNSSSELVTVKCFPFPSVLRGGYHYIEMVDLFGQLSGIDAINAFSRHVLEQTRNNVIKNIFVQTNNYDAGIVYCNEEFRKWITEIHGISVILKFDKKNASNLLCLPPKTYPTISNIVNGPDRSASISTIESSNIFVVDESNYNPNYKIVAATFSPILGDLEVHKFSTPFYLENLESSSHHLKMKIIPSCILQSSTKSPSALHPPQDPTREIFVKNAIDKSQSIIAIIDVNDLDSITEEFILAISGQKGVNLQALVFIVQNSRASGLKNIVDKIFKKWRVNLKIHFASTYRETQKMLRGTSCVLCIDSFVLMQNLYTLKILQANLQKFSAFSSGCLLNHMQIKKGNVTYDSLTVGMQLSINNYVQTRQISLESKNIAAFLLPTEIKVIANNHDLTLYDTDSLLDKIEKYDNINDFKTIIMSMACNNSSIGKVSICTTKISSSYIRPPVTNSMFRLDRESTNLISNNLSKILTENTNIVQLLP